MVVFIVAPFILCPAGDLCNKSAERGVAIVGVQDQWTRDTALGQNGLTDKGGRQFRTFALMDFPAHNFPAEDVHPSHGLKANHCRAADQIEVEEHARDRSGHLGDIPRPDLAGRTGFVACG
jgi:hypothetical protein